MDYFSVFRNLLAVAGLFLITCPESEGFILNIDFVESRHLSSLSKRDIEQKMAESREHLPDGAEVYSHDRETRANSADDKKIIFKNLPKNDTDAMVYNPSLEELLRDLEANSAMQNNVDTGDNLTVIPLCKEGEKCQKNKRDAPHSPHDEPIIIVSRI